MNAALFARVLLDVSIRTRQPCRVNDRLLVRLAQVQRFNPHPAALPGEWRYGALSNSKWKSFNPHPAALPGEWGEGLGILLDARRFNPHPAALPGEWAAMDSCSADRTFQSAPGSPAG